MMSLNENNVKMNKVCIKDHGRACKHCDELITFLNTLNLRINTIICECLINSANFTSFTYVAITALLRSFNNR